MSTSSEIILDRLAEVGFSVRDDSVEVFGEQLPLVVGVAWDTQTAQLALVAETDGAIDLDQWRQLLFAGSGLRHHLATDGPTAFGTPVILALVDDEGERCLRSLCEDLVRNYALFRRVDLNLVRYRALAEPDELDDALAPLLPRCRGLLGEEISHGEVQRFWAKLGEEVALAAGKLDDLFGAYRKVAAEETVATLIGDAAEAPELPAPAPLESIALHNFRSFADASVSLPQVAILHGANGSGKTSVLEALELLWARCSQRKPPDVDAETYAQHLARDGVGGFSVQSSQISVSAVAERPIVELPRCVLNHETASELVSRSPDDRYMAFLTTTGLQIPDLRARTAAIVSKAKQAADTALAEAGLQPLPRSDSHARRYLTEALAGDFAKRLPHTHDLVGCEQALASAANGVYEPRSWDDHEDATDALVQLDDLIATILVDRPSVKLVTKAFDVAADTLRLLIGPRRAAAAAGAQLRDAISRGQRQATNIQSGPRNTMTPLPSEMAARWLAHGDAVVDASLRFHADAKRLTDQTWTRRLFAYAEALDAALEVFPRKELEALTRSRQASEPSFSAELSIDDELYTAAGFAGPVKHPVSLLAPLGTLVTRLLEDADTLQRLVGELENHPSRRFGEHADSVLAAICRFELARTLRREGPIMAASEDLVNELLAGRLAPVVRELVASITRFEWYFKPLLIPSEQRKIVLGGLSTSRPNLDARLVLNSAERAIVGLGWFLGLHLLQPEHRRQVLVLDDPAIAFDLTNQAGFISTLRAFLRLTRPGQVVITSHDDSVAALLADELAPVDGWPTAARRIRCERNAEDLSVIVSQPEWETSSTIEHEATALGLFGQSTFAT